MPKVEKPEAKARKKYIKNPLEKKYGFHVHSKKKQNSGQTSGVLQRQSGGQGQTSAVEMTTNQLKKELRNHKRLLSMFLKKNSNDPNDSLVNSTRATTNKNLNENELNLKIKSLLQRIELNENLKLENDLSEKYKYLKFVERKKVARRLKKAVDQEEINECKNYFDFIDYYPKDLKYLALFPSSSNDNNDDEHGDDDGNAASKAITTTEKRREEIMEKIKEYKEQGLLKPGFVWRWKSRNDTTLDPELLDSDHELDTSTPPANQDVDQDGSVDLEKDDFFV